MTIAAMLLKAPHVGVRELKAHLSQFLKKKSPFIVTERGVPVDVVLPYAEVIEMVELIDEAADFNALSAVHEGRHAVKEGAKGIPVLRLFNKIRKQRK